MVWLSRLLPSLPWKEVVLRDIWGCIGCLTYIGIGIIVAWVILAIISRA